MMIRVNELRIGNYIQRGYSVDNAYCIHKVTGTEEGTVRVDNGGNYAAELLLPIPLTPEWLERCGFEWDNGYLKIDLKNARMKLGFFKGARDKMTLFQTSCPGNGSKITTLQFGWNHPENIHQLQNLYFALIGEELNVKL